MLRLASQRYKYCMIRQACILLFYLLYLQSANSQKMVLENLPIYKHPK